MSRTYAASGARAAERTRPSGRRTYAEARPGIATSAPAAAAPAEVFFNNTRRVNVAIVNPPIGM